MTTNIFPPLVIGELSDVKAELELKINTITLLEQDKDRWKSRAQSIMQKYDRVDPAEFNACKLKVEELEKNIEELTSQKSELEKLSETLKNQKETLVAVHTKALESKTKQIEELQAKAGAVAGNATEYETTKAELITLQTRFENLKNESIQKLKSRRDESKKLRDDYKNLSEELAQANESHSKYKESINDQIEKYNKEISELKSQVEKNKEEKTRLETQVSELEGKLAAAQSNVAGDSSSSEAVETAKINYLKEKQALQENYQKQIDSLQLEITTLKSTSTDGTAGTTPGEGFISNEEHKKQLEEQIEEAVGKAKKTLRAPSEAKLKEIAERKVAIIKAQMDADLKEKEEALQKTFDAKVIELEKQSPGKGDSENSNVITDLKKKLEDANNKVKAASSFEMKNKLLQGKIEKIQAERDSLRQQISGGGQQSSPANRTNPNPNTGHNISPSQIPVHQVTNHNPQGHSVILGQNQNHNNQPQQMQRLQGPPRQRPTTPNLQNQQLMNQVNSQMMNQHNQQLMNQVNSQMMNQSNAPKISHNQEGTVNKNVSSNLPGRPGAIRGSHANRGSKLPQPRGGLPRPQVNRLKRSLPENGPNVSQDKRSRT